MYIYIIVIIFFILLEWKNKKELKKEQKIYNAELESYIHKCNPEVIKFVNDLNEYDIKFIKHHLNKSEHIPLKKNIHNQIKNVAMGNCGSFISNKLFNSAVVNLPFAAILTYILQNHITI